MKRMCRSFDSVLWSLVQPTQTDEAREAQDQVKGQLEGQAYFSYFFHHITLMHSQEPQHHQQGISTTGIEENQFQRNPACNPLFSYKLMAA